MEKQTYQYSHIEDVTEKYLTEIPDKNGFYLPVYTKSKLKSDNGNPFIECLPAPKTGRPLCLKYTVPIVDYDRQKIYTMLRNHDNMNLANSIMQLKELRVPLPMNYELEDDIYRLLIQSYRNRSMMSDDSVMLPVHMGGEEGNVNSKLYTKFTSSAPSGIAVLGYAGSGKTIAVHMMLADIPQVIIHSTKETPQFTQVVWLDIECAPNSNLGAVWDGFGSALDRALHNLDGYYHNMIARKHNTSAKMEIVIDLIQQFNIGVICFDEIEHINFSANRESTFEEFLYLQDKTHVGLVVIGTEETYLKMFGQLRSQRRFNTVIHASSYCHDNYADIVARQIMAYQWFTPAVDINNPEIGQPLIQAMLDCSKGIVDQMITLWTLVNLSLATSKKQENLTPEFIKTIAQKEIPQVTNDLLNHLNDPMAGNERERLNKEAEQKMLNEIRSQDTKKKTESLAHQVDQTSMQGIQSIIQDAIKFIHIYNNQFSDEIIKKAVLHVISQDGGEKLSHDQIIREATEYLTSKEKAKVSEKKKPVKKNGSTMSPAEYLNNAHQDVRPASAEERV